MIIRPFLYDIKKTITSKTVLILVAIILLISLTIIPFTSRSIVNTGGFSQPNVLFYRDGGYHFLSFSGNQYGDPVSGISFSISLIGAKNYTQTIVTNSTGLALFTFNVPYANYTAEGRETTPNGDSSFSLSVPNYSPGVVQALDSPVFSAVVDKHNASKRDLQVFYAASNGALPTAYSVYFQVATSPPFTSYTKNQMIFLGTMDNYHQVFDPPIPAGLNNTAQVFFELFGQNNNTATWTSEFAIFELRPQQPAIVVTNAAAFFFSGVLGFFIPLMTIIGSYSSYGKDRLTGVLESVLSRPITRRGLAMSRFLSTLSAFSIAVIASVGVVDLVLNSVAGSFLPQDYTLAIIAGLVVEVAAFTGLIFLLSHLVKSTGLLLGLSIGLFVVLDFFWGLIIFLLTLLLGGAQGSFVGLQATYLSYYANPAQFLNLVNAYVLQSSVGAFVSPSSYGVTLPAIVLDGIIWAVAPFIIFLYLAIKRD